MGVSTMVEMEALVAKIQYKPGWEFRAVERIELNRIMVGVCLTTVEQDPEKRKIQEHERGFVWDPAREPKTLVWWEIPFPIPELRELSDEMIVGKIWEQVIAIEAHEIQEFFRYDGLCVQEPHPEAPRELAFDGALDTFDFIHDLMTMKGRNGLQV